MDAQRRVVYLFSGSSLSLLSDVFGQEGTSPLYQMVGRTFLGELPSKHVISFVKRRLRAVHGATLPKEAADRFYERVGGIPYYVQKLGLAIERRLVFEGVQAIGAEHVDIGFDALLDELDLDFQERFTTRFSLQQQTILLAIADDAATSAAIAERQQTAPENLTYSLKKLVGTMILSKDGSAYRVTDRVFGGWLARLRVGGV